MATEIYYFSGTGNSLFLARELKKHLPDATLIPIVRTLNSGKVKTSADCVGIVFPIYAVTYPDIIEDFISALEWDNPPYLFAVASRKCDSRAFAEIDSILSEKGGSFLLRFQCRCRKITCLFSRCPIRRRPKRTAKML